MGLCAGRARASLNEMGPAAAASARERDSSQELVQSSPLPVPVCDVRGRIFHWCDDAEDGSLAARLGLPP